MNPFDYILLGIIIGLLLSIFAEFLLTLLGR